MRLVSQDGATNNGEFTADTCEGHLVADLIQRIKHVVLGLAQLGIAALELAPGLVRYQVFVGQQEHAQSFRAGRRHRATFGKPACTTPAVCMVSTTSSFCMVTSGASITLRLRLCARAIIWRSS